MTHTPTTTTTTTTTEATTPLLPEGMLACPGCGVAVLEPDDAGDLVLAYPVAETFSGRPQHVRPVRLARCTNCQEIRDQAEALLATHPRVVARRGTVAADHLEAVLMALTVLGLPDPVEVPEIEVSSLLNHLAAPGATVRWLQHFMPSLTVDRDAYSVFPWQHVSPDDLDLIRSGYAAVLRDRIARNAPPLQLPPPALDLSDTTPGTVPLTGACLLCGVGRVTVPSIRLNQPGGREAAAHDFWREISCSPAALGGRATASPVVGHLCMICSAAVQRDGLGPTARENAVLAYWRASGRTEDAERLKSDLMSGPPPLPAWGVVAYAAHRADRPAPAPNVQPWGHLPSEVTRV